MGRHFLRCAVITALVALVPAVPASAQELTGTYITYADVGTDGTLISGGRSMQYRETATGMTTCDLYTPGVPDEGFFVNFTTPSGTMSASNAYLMGTSFMTTSATTVSGRTITWSGTYGSQMRVDETLTFETDDRALKLTVVVTNLSTSAWTDLYYLRSGDPDHGSTCGFGTGPQTDNDVLRQPPTDADAIVTAGAGLVGVADHYAVFGLGAHDARARATSNGGLIFTDPVSAWNTPLDPGGANGDQSVSLVFKEPSLAAGASTTFELWWVWGPDTATVLMRFDESGTPPCTGADGSACSSATGAAGTCHATRCCTGCWDGAACHAAGTTTACGIAGGSCTDCTDGNLCTQDVCSRTAGTCSHPGMPTTTACSDGLFCTASDHCDGTSACVGTGSPCDDANSCTTDSCSEPTDSCGHATLADLTGCPSGVCRSGACCTGCWNGTSCQGGFLPAVCGIAGALCTSCIDGDQCTNDVCTTGACSNPLSSTTVACDDGMYCTTGDHCDGADHCTSGAGTPCDDGSTCTTDTCDESTDACMHAAASGICAIFGSCFAAGDRNPSNRCQVCDPTMSASAWTIATGMDCGTGVCAAGMITPSPTCSATGVCTPSTRMPCPSGFCTSPTMCASACTMDSECGSPGYCDMTTGMCTPRLASGTVCDRDAMCAGAALCSADHHCCGSACAGPCQSCAIPGNLGRCLPVPAGTDPDGECAPGETCSASGACGAGGTDAGTADMGGGTDMGTPSTDMGGGGDAAVAHDGGGMDAGRGSMGAGGCCRVGGTGGTDAPLGVLAGLAGLAVLVVVRRRRKAC